MKRFFSSTAVVVLALAAIGMVGVGSAVAGGKPVAHGGPHPAPQGLKEGLPKGYSWAGPPKRPAPILHPPLGRTTSLPYRPLGRTTSLPYRPLGRTTTSLPYRKFGSNGFCLPGTFKGWSRGVWSARYRCRCYYNPRDCRWYYFYPRCQCFLPWSCITICPPCQLPPPNIDPVNPPSDDPPAPPDSLDDPTVNPPSDDPPAPPDSPDDPTNGDSEDGN